MRPFGLPLRLGQDPLDYHNDQVYSQAAFYTEEMTL